MPEYLEKQTAELLSDIDTSIEKARQVEREKILIWLANYGLAEVEPYIAGPKWRAVIWALVHPVRFGQAVAIGKAVRSINDCAHLEEAA